MATRFILFVAVWVVTDVLATEERGFGHGHGQAGSRGNGIGGSGGSYSGGVASIVHDQRRQNTHEEYDFHYQTSDGTERQEEGKQNDGQVVRGGFRYISPEGIPVDISFVADHGGFQPVGNVLPVAPPMPFKFVQVHRREKTA